MGNYEAIKVLQAKYGPKVGVAILGPAGEMRLTAANISFADPQSNIRSAGRGGLGAVMAVTGNRIEDREKSAALAVQAARTVDEARSQADELQLSSPIDGEVKEAVAKRGELVSPGYPVMPMLTVQQSVSVPSRTQACPRACRRRSAAVRAVSLSVWSSSAPNSSPPRRAMTSVVRIVARRVAARAVSSASPAACV